jgi:hypothetical protein
MEVKDSHFLKEYRNQVKDALKKLHPDWKDDFLKKNIDEIILRELRNPETTLENDYTHELRQTNLVSVFDWLMETKPIIAANGTFFKQHKDAINPNALMVDDFLVQRARIKKEMFAIEDESSRAYASKDIKQGNEKRLANSYYGASGMKASAFYNQFTAPCTTKSAQSVISTAETTFEAFLASNFNFVDINECYFWIQTVLDEKVKCEDWIKRVPLDICYERISSAVIGATDEDRETLREFMESLSEEDITRIYWKNNLIAFTDAHDEVKAIWDTVFSTVDNYEYMKSDDDFSVVPEEYLEEVKSAKKPMKKWASIVDFNYFYNPNKVPKSIEKYVDALKDIYMDYCYVEFMYTDRIYKLKNFRRDVVTVIDTDSNILSLDTFMEYCLENLKHGEYGRDPWNNVFIAVNTITYTITAVITKTLLYYGEMSNVEESIRPRYSMKNEFFFSNLILAKVKKRYLSKVLLREGNRLLKPKYDVKGFDFKKASTSDDASNFFMHIVKDLILEPEQLDIKRIMKEIQNFRYEVRRTIESGDKRYLPIASAKELDAYATPDREQSVRGALAWNVLYPDRAVELPVKLSLLKTTITSIDMLSDLQRTDPQLYTNIKTGIFEDTTGTFNRKLSNGKGIQCEGLTVLGIPLHEDIPQWIIPFVDYTTVINSVVAPFKSVTETFNMPSIEEGKTGRKTTGFSNIIKI